MDALGADRTEHIRAILTRLETGSDILYTPNVSPLDCRYIDGKVAH
jgi:hypothetical protein